MTTNSTDSAPLPDTLYLDADLVAVNKPSGIPVQPDRTGAESLLDIMIRELGEPGLGLVHRIDRPVSGVVLFARNADSRVACDRLFRERRVAKRYWAIVEGTYDGGDRSEHYLVHDPKSRRARVVRADAPHAKLCVTLTRVLAIGDRYTLLEAVPEGGAFHQIRAQLAASGHAIKGDVKYGARRAERDRSIALHARELAFEHPMQGKPVSIMAPGPSSPLWQALIASMIKP